MEIKNKSRIAFTGDGLFLPLCNGAYYSTYCLMCALSKDGKVEPTLAHCYRGWEDPTLFHHQTFNTLFLKPEDYYRDTKVLNYAFNVFGIQAVQILNAEEVLNLGRRLKETRVKVIYEVLNIDHVLYTQLGIEEKKSLNLKTQQVEACHVSDHVLCRSEVDREHLIRMGVEPRRVTVYTGAINVKGIAFAAREHRRFRVVFLGHMYYPPNENALKLIADRILPQLKKMDSRYTVTVVGIAPRSMVEEYRRLGIIFRGRADDLSAELMRYDIAIAPLYEGSGTRLKVLDYLASGIPTITTTLGIEGLKQDLAQYVIVENDIHRYPERIHEVMRGLADYRSLVYNGRRFIEAHYDWEQCLGPFLNTYQKLLT